MKGYYLAVVTAATKVATGPYDAPLFRIDDMECLPVSRRAAEARHHSPEDHRDEVTYLRLLRQIAETRSFYFGVGYDLTLSLQRHDAVAAGAAAAAAASTGRGVQAREAAVIAALAAGPSLGASVSRASPNWRLSDDRFFWNRSASREMMAAGADAFVTPVINGFVGSCALGELAPGGGSSSSLLLVSRRACLRQGTRFNMRGADLDGNVANYAETEQLLLVRAGGGGVGAASFVQVGPSLACPPPS